MTSGIPFDEEEYRDYIGPKEYESIQGTRFDAIRREEYRGWKDFERRRQEGLL